MRLLNGFYPDALGHPSPISADATAADGNKRRSLLNIYQMRRQTERNAHLLRYLQDAATPIVGIVLRKWRLRIYVLQTKTIRPALQRQKWISLSGWV
jgi:hypothetical protein